MSGFYTIILLILSNIFMTLAWYGHLKLQQTGTSSHWPLIGVIVFSWMIAFFEYCCQVPANRIGFVRRTVLTRTAEGCAGMRQPHCLCRDSQRHVPGRIAEMESSACLCIPRSGSISCFQIRSHAEDSRTNSIP